MPSVPTTRTPISSHETVPMPSVVTMCPLVSCAARDRQLLPEHRQVAIEAFALLAFVFGALAHPFGVRVPRQRCLVDPVDPAWPQEPVENTHRHTFFSVAT